MIMPVDAVDVVDDLAAAVDAEVHVDIRHGHALRIQESLEKETVFYRVDLGYMQAVGHDAARGAPAAGADRDAAALGVADEVGDDEEIVHKAHLVYHAQLVVELLVYLRLAGVALREALLAELFQIFIAVALALRELEARQVIVTEFKVVVAALGDADGVVGGFLPIGEELSHLLLALQIQLLRLEAHTVRIVDRLAHLDAHEHVLIIGVSLLDIVRVVRQRKRDSRLLMDLYKPLRGLPLFGDIVILYLKIKVILAEQIPQFHRLRLGGLVIAANDLLRYLAREAAGETDKPLGMLMQQRPVDARLDIEALGEGHADKVAEIFVALLVFAQEDQVRIVVVYAVLLVGHVPRRDIDLTADYGLDALGLTGLIERDRAVHDAVVGYCKRRLPQLLRLADKLFDAAGSVQQGIFGMHM